ncbi:hypothetical protein ATO10_12314 [Actibacterium atlanticum]|uniref:Uncharacterized protein n=1 Tax=Actibacterium atlanticum TaxID=1461693 RepID=A0A058ZJI7_9RHOB|nr:DUF6638 family protein [Actibacterium atlanticum]KCV81390.1 hypothetical protein ATO10_12314 [Actibacterium atlanticum]
MKRLIEKGLMFGNLIEVSSPALIARYNRALKHLTGRETALQDFHIDIAGYSPEVGDELGDHLYLNPNGVNRQFILLTTEQKTAPLLGAKFSTSRGLLRRFIEENEPQLFALTAQDAVAGELANSVFELSSPKRLFDIRKITVEADTTRSHVANADKLADKITQFRTKEDAWFDDVLIAEMITLAKETGDVTRNPVQLKPTEMGEVNFWTSHFGGLYLFPTLETPGVIAMAGDDQLGDLPVPNVYGPDERNAIAHFLTTNDLIEPIVKARNVDAAAILRQKMDFILVDAAATLGHDMGEATRHDLRKLAYKLGAALPDAFQGLADLLRWVEGGGQWPRITSEHPSYFYTLRAKSGPDRDLVNQLLAELAPLDVRQLFICHKQLFYRLYAGWSDDKKTFVANFLEREYLVDKVGARAALFGPEPDMTTPPPKPNVVPDRIVDLVGPWGAVRKGR